MSVEDDNGKVEDQWWFAYLLQLLKEVELVCPRKQPLLLLVQRLEVQLRFLG